MSTYLSEMDCKRCGETSVRLFTQETREVQNDLAFRADGSWDLEEELMEEPNMHEQGSLRCASCNHDYGKIRFMESRNLQETIEKRMQA